jgi:holo-[acyl-carrier protein] synthase
MKILVGIDVQSISEVEHSLRTYGPRYTRRLFTDHELSSCASGAKRSAEELASRFAAKEAVLKVLDVTDVVPSWKDIEVRWAATGRPAIALGGDAAAIARRQGVQQMSLSLSHAGDTAGATVIAEISPNELGASK